MEVHQLVLTVFYFFFLGSISINLTITFGNLLDVNKIAGVV